MITRVQFFILSFTLLACINFLIANSCGLYLQHKGWLTVTGSDKWYFLSNVIKDCALLWVARTFIKDKNLFFFIAFDLFLNFACLGFIAEWLTKNTRYFISQYVAAFISLLISIWQYNRMKNKQ